MNKLIAVIAFFVAFESASANELLGKSFSLKDYQQSLRTGEPITIKDEVLPESLASILRERGFDENASPSRVANFVLGGQNAIRGEYPEFAQIAVLVGEDFFLWCSGTMIASNKALTAAHCAQRDIGEYLVIPGYYSINDTFTAADISSLSGLNPHPNYNDVSTTSDFDVAILTLDKHFSTPFAKVHTGSELFAGRTGVLVGSGLIATDPDNTTTPILQKVSAPVRDNQQCMSIWQNLTPNDITVITPRMMCAGFVSDSRGSCSGDSGGPLWVNVEGQRVMVGSVSFGVRPCESNRGNQVYARLSEFTSFIAQQSPTTTFVQVDIPERPQSDFPVPVISLLLDE